MNLREHLILYVDDEHANRVVFEVSFGKLFRIKCVNSGEDALTFLAQEHAAVIVTDQRMTGMSGDELLRKVKDSSPDTVRMILTAYSDLEPILGAVNEGLVARYVIKPWDRAELEETLRWALEAYAAGRQNNALQLRLMQTERLRTLGQVSATVLHDLNQPVMAVSMSAEQLAELSKIAPVLLRLSRGEDTPLSSEERATLGQLGEDLPELAGSLSSCASFMSDLMKQMKQFQRHETAPPPSMGDVAPLPVLKLALTMCRSGSLTSGSKLSYEGPPSLPHVRATSTDLMQIFVNLVRNAQQALEEHRVRHGAVVVEAAVRGDGVTFGVRDNGPGIPREVLAKLGTPFFTTREAGTGLGISQVKRLVGRLGGEVQIESAEGEGTRVSFTLPTMGAT
ncbi:MAG TPA: hybrid sensor histidine kinase/response regulator [Labilithrix sp.]|nr:hybrid sensor histidine kinase/response regulator [Labilithrix sp.]